MKKIFFLCVVIVSIVLMPGCQKLDEYLSVNPGTDFHACNIKWLVKTSFNAQGEEQPSSRDTVEYKYNKWGNPVYAKQNISTSGRTHKIFEYDAANRLIQMIGVYANGVEVPVPGIRFETLSKYYYDGSNNIVRDTTYIFGETLNGGDFNYQTKRVTKYTYDAKGRMIKEVMTWIKRFTGNELDEPGIIMVYEYDSKGNLANTKMSYTGSEENLIDMETNLVYDTKFNYLRTNKIWMFLERDYSINNRYKLLSFNKYLLPTSIIVGRGTDKKQIEYFCN